MTEIATSTPNSAGPISTTSDPLCCRRHRRGPRILLGVTGSVAAVKAPEIACRLLDELGAAASRSNSCCCCCDGNCAAQVKVLLTAGGRNFWEKAAEYDPIYWNKLQGYLLQQQGAVPQNGPLPNGNCLDSNDNDAASAKPAAVSAVTATPSQLSLPSIQVHCEYMNNNKICMSCRAACCCFFLLLVLHVSLAQPRCAIAACFETGDCPNDSFLIFCLYSFDLLGISNCMLACGPARYVSYI